VDLGIFEIFWPENFPDLGTLLENTPYPFGKNGKFPEKISGDFLDFWMMGYPF
jgi:hypothetical protein